MMKKVLSLLFMLVCVSNIVFAADCKYYKCVEPYDMNSKFRTAVGTVTGLNFTSGKVAQSIIRKDIEKNIKSDKLKVKFKSYTAKDLKNGIFKSLNVKADNINAKGIYLSHLEMQTLCDFNYIKSTDNGEVIFKEDFPMSFDTVITLDDINKTLSSEQYQNIIENVNRYGLGGIKISSVEADIRADHFYLIIYINTPFAKNFKKIIVGTNVSAENGEVVYSKTFLTASSTKIDLRIVDYILNRLNPLNFSFNILNDKKAHVYVTDLKIDDNIIKAKGISVIPKN